MNIEEAVLAKNQTQRREDTERFSLRLRAFAFNKISACEKN